jgi:hypothetical protein
MDFGIGIQRRASLWARGDGRSWDARVVSERRVRAYTRITLAAFIVLWSVCAFSGWGTRRRHGAPLGADFVTHYAAGTLAHGQAASAYDPAGLNDAEHQLVTGSTQGHLWSYPPDLLLALRH